MPTFTALAVAARRAMRSSTFWNLGSCLKSRETTLRATSAPAAPVATASPERWADAAVEVRAYRWRRDKHGRARPRGGHPVIHAELGLRVVVLAVHPAGVHGRRNAHGPFRGLIDPAHDAGSGLPVDAVGKLRDVRSQQVQVQFALVRIPHARPARVG